GGEGIDRRSTSTLRTLSGAAEKRHTGEAGSRILLQRRGYVKLVSVRVVAKRNASGFRCSLSHIMHDGPVSCRRFSKTRLSDTKQCGNRAQQHSGHDSGAQKSDLSTCEVLARVAQHVRVPEHLPVAKGQLTDAVRAAVVEARRRQYTILPPRSSRRLQRSTSS